METEYQKHNASIYKHNSFKSNCVLFQHNNLFYALTAGHTIYGKKFDEDSETTEFIIKDDFNNSFKVELFCTTNIFAKEHDLCLLKITCEDQTLIENFPTLHFTTIPNNKKIKLFWRGNYNPRLDKIKFDNVTFNEISSENKSHFFLRTDKINLIGHNERYGAEWMSGVSGSGLFTENTFRLYCSGLLIEIPDHANTGVLKFASVEPIRNVLDNLELTYFSELESQYITKSELSAEMHDLFNFRFDLTNYFPRGLEQYDTTAPNTINLEYLINKNPNNNYVDLLLNQSNKDIIILLGNPGIGKSTELKYLTRLIHESDDTDYLATYINLNNFTSDKNVSDYFQYNNLNKFHSIFFVLDGIDEIPNPQDLRVKLNQFILEAKQNKHNHKLLISCRTNIYFSKSVFFENSVIYKLKHLVFEESKILFERFISRSLTDDETNQLLSISNFLSNPYQVKLVAEYFLENDNKLETKLAKLWQKYIDNRLKKDKTGKLIRLEQNIPKIKKNALRFSFTAELMQTAILTEEQLDQIIPQQQLYNDFITCSLIESTHEPSYYLENKQIQEFLVAEYLSFKTLDEIYEIILINNTTRIIPSIMNVVSFLINILDDKKLEYFMNWLSENQMELLLKADSDRIESYQVIVFQKIFEDHCIKKSLWITTGNSFSIQELAQFGNCKENFDYLFSIIGNKSHHFRARISALELLFFFDVYDISKMLNSFYSILEDPENSFEFKSSVIKNLIKKDLTNDKSVQTKIFELFQNETNKEINNAILKFVNQSENPDDHFQYIHKEFRRSFGIDKRAEEDRLHRGNTTSVISIMLKLKDPRNFLKLAIYFCNDFRAEYSVFEEKLIARFVYFNEITHDFQNKFLSTLKESPQHRNSYNEKLLVEIIKKTKMNLIVFKFIYENENFVKNDGLLAKIANKDCIKYLIKTISSNNDLIDQTKNFRNKLTFYNSYDLAKDFEIQIEKLGIDYDQDQLKPIEEYDKIREQLNLEIRKNFNLLFNSDDLYLKVIEVFPDNLEYMDQDQMLEIETTFYQNDPAWQQKENIGFDFLSHAIFLYGRINKKDIISLINDKGFLLQIILKWMDSTPLKNEVLELSNEQYLLINKWIKEEVTKVDFNNVLEYFNTISFHYKGNGSYILLKTLLSYFNKPPFRGSFEQIFILNSLEFLEFEDSSEQNKFFDLGTSFIEDKLLLRNKIVANIEKGIFSFSQIRHMHFALKNNYSEAYPIIRLHLSQDQNIYGKDSLLKEYLERTNDFELLKEISNDLSTNNAWIALELMLTRKRKDNFDFIRDKVTKYLEGSYKQFLASAFKILLMLNDKNDLIIKFYVKNINEPILTNLNEIHYSCCAIHQNETFQYLPIIFNNIYSMNRDEFEYSYHRTFLSYLINNTAQNEYQYDSLKAELIAIRESLNTVSSDSSDYDTKLFFINLHLEEAEKNYFDILSKPLNFEAAFIRTNNILQIN